MLLIIRVAEWKPVTSFCCNVLVMLSSGLQHSPMTLESGTHPLATFSDPEVSEEILTWMFKIVLGVCCTSAKDKWLPLSQEFGEIILHFTVVVRRPLLI